MAYIEWSESFSVNVKEIDEQHKKLIGIINISEQINKELSVRLNAFKFIIKIAKKSSGIIG